MSKNNKKNMNNNLKEEKNVILINKMCVGSYTINNIGHEIINYFKANDGNVYIYISPYGSMSKEYDNKIETILLTSALSNHKIEIIAKIDNPKQEILFKKNKKTQEGVHKEQVEKYKNVLYGGKRLDEIFINNYNNEKAIYITFKANADDMKKPKEGTHFFIINEEDYSKWYKENSDRNCIYIPIKENIASQSLKQYFKKNKNKTSYENIKKYLDDKYWENFNPEEIPENIKDGNEEINFLQLIEKEDEEQIYTNMFWYWFSRDNIFNEFLEFIKLDNLKDKYNIEKEKVIPGGRTDIMAFGEKNIIVIENKILSGINGIEKDEEGHIIKTQLSKYIKGIEEKQKKGDFFKKEEKKEDIIDERKIKGLIFIPDYKIYDLENEINNIKKQNSEEKECIEKNYNIITYSKLYEFFNKENIKEKLFKDLYGNKYYNDFLNSLELHKQTNISEKNKIEMKRKFMYAIMQADKEKKE